MFSVRMHLLLLVLVLSTMDAASVKKRTGDSANQLESLSKISKPHPTSSTTASSPAIVAIEILDAPGNNTLKSKSTSKRTIESSLGYGYHNVHESNVPKKFVIYKYSQHDIPPISYTPQQGNYANQIDIQKSVAHHLGSTTAYLQPPIESNLPKPVYGPPSNVYYSPGNTLYTTLSNHGQLGGLSTQVPYQNFGHAGAVPVIFLRVYSNQLDNPQTALHTNLPQENPYSGLNNINLQSFLQNYVQQYLQSQQVAAPYQVSNHQQYYQAQPNYHQDHEYESNLPTSENYPSKHHTRVIFHSNNNGHIPVPQEMYKTPGLSTYKAVSVPTYVAPPSNNNQYEYTYDTQPNQQQYMYVYPAQVDQNAYYQQEEQSQEQQQQYQISEQGQANYNEIQVQPNGVPSEREEHTNAPFNYHAHPRVSSKHRRSQLSSIEVSSTLPPKRREPRDKST